MNNEKFKEIVLFFIISVCTYAEIYTTQTTPRPVKKSKTNNHVSLFQCPYDDCNKALSTQAGIRTHIQSVHEGIRFICFHPECDKTFSTKQSMLRHFNSTHLGKRVICSHPECNETFSLKGNMQTHYKSTHLGKQFLCSHPGCNKTFSRNNNMLRHFRKKHSTAIRKKRKQSPEQIVAEVLLSIRTTFLKEREEESNDQSVESS